MLLEGEAVTQFYLTPPDRLLGFVHRLNLSFPSFLLFFSLSLFFSKGKCPSPPLLRPRLAYLIILDQGKKWGMSSSSPTPQTDHIKNNNAGLNKQHLIIALGVGLSVVTLIIMCLLYAPITLLQRVQMLIYMYVESLHLRQQPPQQLRQQRTSSLSPLPLQKTQEITQRTTPPQTRRRVTYMHPRGMVV